MSELVGATAATLIYECGVEIDKACGSIIGRDWARAQINLTRAILLIGPHGTQAAPIPQATEPNWQDLILQLRRANTLRWFEPSRAEAAEILAAVLQAVAALPVQQGESHAPSAPSTAEPVSAQAPSKRNPKPAAARKPRKQRPTTISPEEYKQAEAEIFARIDAMSAKRKRTPKTLPGPDTEPNIYDYPELQMR